MIFLKKKILILTLIFSSLFGLGVHAEVIVNNETQPDLLKINLKDSNLLVTKGNSFSISVTKSLKGVRFSFIDSEKILSQIQVSYNKNTSELFVSTPRLVIGTAIAEIHITVANPIQLKIKGEDGDVHLTGLSLLDSSVELEDGSVQIDKSFVSGQVNVKTQDGNVFVQDLSSSTSVQASSKGDGKVQIFNTSYSNPGTEKVGFVKISTEDGDIKVF